MGWLLTAAALVGLGWILWDQFLHGRRGPGRLVGALTLLAACALGVAMGADASALVVIPGWILLGLAMTVADRRYPQAKTLGVASPGEDASPERARRDALIGWSVFGCLVAAIATLTVIDSL